MKDIRKLDALNAAYIIHTMVHEGDRIQVHTSKNRPVIEIKVVK